MSTKQFYIICLIGITFLGGSLLLLLWRKLKDKLPENKGILFIALAMFSWTTVGLYKIFDPPMPSLIHAINDRILSAFSNLFLIAALPYFSNLFLKSRERFSFFRKTEQWVINVFIFFAIVTALFTMIDRNVEGDFGKKIIIAIDSLLSTVTMALISFALFQSITRFWNDVGSKLFLGTFFILLTSTQISLPLVAIFPEQFKFLYYAFLICLLLGLAFFNFISIAYYSMLYLEVNEIINNDLLKTKRNNLQIEQLILGYDQLKKVYFIEFSFNEQNTIIKERIENTKILLPFANWVLFSIAKKMDVKISNQDISTTKFRMVEYWNKDSENKLNQELLFINDRGMFEFNFDAHNVEIVNIELLEKKFIVREAVQKNIDNFSFKFPNVEKNKLNSIEVFESIKRK